MRYCASVAFQLKSWGGRQHRGRISSTLHHRAAPPGAVDACRNYVRSVQCVHSSSNVFCTLAVRWNRASKARLECMQVKGGREVL
mmetsp:Transcript_135303/g.350587  ORF Transcript_135303/g.350587 Transcript_135303/m.350587 type:complete len:85 (+) Transcript_135303:1355-1609(+)